MIIIACPSVQSVVRSLCHCFVISSLTLHNWMLPHWLADQRLPSSEGHQGPDGAWPHPDGLGPLKPTDLHQGNQYLRMGKRCNAFVCYLWWVSHVAETFQRFWVLAGFYCLPYKLPCLNTFLFDAHCVCCSFSPNLRCNIWSVMTRCLCPNYDSAGMLSACLMIRSAPVLLWGLACAEH